MNIFYLALGGAAAAALLAASRKTGTVGSAKPLDTRLGVPPSSWTLTDYQNFAAMSQRLGINPADLMLVIFSESGGNPRAANPGRTKEGNSVATGLSQLTPVSNGATGLTESQRADIVNQPVSVQLPIIERYYKAMAWTQQRRGYPHAGIVYANNYLPARLLSRGSSLDTVLTKKGESFYDSNTILDANKDGEITVSDLVEHLRKVSRSGSYLGALAMLRQVTGNPTLSPNLPSL